MLGKNSVIYAIADIEGFTPSSVQDNWNAEENGKVLKVGNTTKDLDECFYYRVYSVTEKATGMLLKKAVFTF